MKQLPHMERILQPRYDGLSLVDLEMDMDTESIYEMELTGLPIDLKRVEDLTEKYQSKRRDLESKFMTMILARGLPPTFNYRSVDHVRELLFGIPIKDIDGKEKGGLGLIPIMTTKPKGGQKKKWSWVKRQPPEIQKNYNPSTDKQTLEILEEAHPMVYHMLNLRRVDTICKNFLREDDDGGIRGNMWPDGRLHARIGQTTDTGRLRTAAPNIQNWSKQAERFLIEIFGKEACPLPMRTICVAPDGWVFVEADWKQAELFVLSGLSDDHAMTGDLTTPGKDVHTSTTLDSFKIQRLWPDMSPVDDAQVLDLAKKDLAAFEKLEKTFIYKNARGKCVTHEEFKGSVRTAGKAVSFGKNTRDLPN
jgi:DNA polymerase I-like protein with 3'-5' exonuclease and polymerase domains